jgi:hypothetical protein
MSVSKRDSKSSERRDASLLAPVDMLVSLLIQPVRKRDGVQEDIDAARQRQRR